MKALIFALVSIVSGQSLAATASLPALDSVKELAGTYTGHWDMFGLDSAGNAKLVLSWNDELALANPQIGVDPFLGEVRAFALATDIMIFKFPAGIPATTIQFTEGFKVQTDGSAGTHYFTRKGRSGQIEQTLETQVGANLWQYASPVDLSSYASLGLNKMNVIFASNFTVKSIVVENAMEKQTISQTTTLIWTAGDGTVQSRQFVSINGIHTRKLEP